MSTSERRASERASSRPLGSRRFSVMHFLLRPIARHHSDVPSLSTRQLRSGSPVRGGSILTTSAPKYASMHPANGPAMSCPISRTRMPARGFAGSEVGCMIGARWVRRILGVRRRRRWCGRRTPVRRRTPASWRGRRRCAPAPRIRRTPRPRRPCTPRATRGKGRAYSRARSTQASSMGTGSARVDGRPRRARRRRALSSQMRARSVT